MSGKELVATKITQGTVMSPPVAGMRILEEEHPKIGLQICETKVWNYCQRDHEWKMKMAR